MISPKPDFWHTPLDTLLSDLKTSPKGLSDSEAASRLKTMGSNEISSEREIAVVYQLLLRFKNPLVILLLIISFVSLLLHQKHDFIIILVMVVMSVGLDFFQEYSAGQAAKKLKESISLQAKVLRGDKLQTIPVKDIVPGDIVYLNAGSMVPADGRVMWENHLFVNQSILTGESFPVEKVVGDLHVSEEGSGGLSEASNAVFMGTSVMSGECHMLVCVTGKKAYLGGIAEGLQGVSPPSKFELETRKFGYFLVKITICLVLFVLMVNIFVDRPWLETFLFALALAVGMSPEFLPMVMSVTLSRGAKKMAKKKVIVKRLSAIHDVGGMTILCTDKTGTLTDAQIQLARHIDCTGGESEEVLKLAYLNSYFETSLKNPMDEAILSHDDIKVEGWQKIDEIPFDFNRRMTTVLLDHGSERVLISKGAPEEIMAACTHYESKNKTLKMTSAARAKLLALYQSESKKGFRILGIAHQSVPRSHKTADIHDEADLIFSGFALFYDPPKRDASQAIGELKAQKIELYILTGDSEDVTAHICQELNIPIQGILLGKEVETLTDKDLKARIPSVNLYCRMNPTQKRRIIIALKELGSVVGFMGDGINDALSLQAAHVGISVDMAADVAKEAADMILLERDLSVVHDAVIEGRKIYANIMKYLMMMTSSNFGNMFSMAGASVILPFLPMLPTQILLNNLLYDMSQTAIPFDNVDEEATRSPQKWNLSLIFKFMLVMGPLSSIFDFSIFYIMLKLMGTPPHLFQTGWFIESLATQVLIIFVIRTRKSIFKSKPHVFVGGLSILLVAIGVLIPYTPLGTYFNFVQPPAYFLLIIVCIVALYLATAERLKFWFYKHFS